MTTPISTLEGIESIIFFRPSEHYYILNLFLG
jgi:hypothetical protein